MILVLPPNMEPSVQDACFHLGPGEKAGSNLDKQGENVHGVAVDVWSWG